MHITIRAELSPRRGFLLERIVLERESAREGTLFYPLGSARVVPEARSDSGTK